MPSQNGRWASGGDGSFQSLFHRLCLRGTWNHAEDHLRRKDHGKCECYPFLRDSVEILKTPVVHLLQPGGPIKLHYLDVLRIMKICNRGIIEGQMPILSDPEAAKCRRDGL